MGALRKIKHKSDKDTWRIDYIDPLGKRIRQNFKKKKDAEAELAKSLALIAEKRYLDVKKEYMTTFGELLAAYKKNSSISLAIRQRKDFSLKTSSSILERIPCLRA